MQSEIYLVVNDDQLSISFHEFDQDLYICLTQYIPNIYHPSELLPESLESKQPIRCTDGAPCLAYPQNGISGPLYKSKHDILPGYSFPRLRLAVLVFRLDEFELFKCPPEWFSNNVGNYAVGQPPRVIYRLCVVQESREGH